jgi:hypothetical protein
MKYASIHHTGGLGQDYNARTQHLTAEQVDNAHRQRFNMVSTLGWFGGYNFFINRRGVLTQFRAIGEETMAQKGHNFDTISICLAGNFTRFVEMPTPEQVATLERLGGALLMRDVATLTSLNVKFLPFTTLDITLDRVLPHRLLQRDTECYGSGLSDSWGRQIISGAYQKKLSQLRKILLDIQDFLKKTKLGVSKANGRTPCQDLDTQK